MAGVRDRTLLVVKIVTHSDVQKFLAKDRNLKPFCEIVLPSVLPTIKALVDGPQGETPVCYQPNRAGPFDEIQGGGAEEEAGDSM